MDESDLRRLAESLDGLDGAITLRLHRGGRPEARVARLSRAIEAVAAAAPRAVAVAEGDGAGPPDLPALTIEDGEGRARAHYAAVPAGPEAAPFGDFLAALARGEADEPLGARLESLGDPAEVLVLVGPTCPHCPGAVREALALAAASPEVVVAVVDAVDRAHLANEHGARSVPFTVIDGELSMTGVVPRGELADAILGRGGAGHAGRLLRGQLDGGRFVEAGRLIATADGRGPFVEAWSASTMSERVALLLAVEEALEGPPGSLDLLVDELVPLLQSYDGSLRGDTADLLGRIGHPSALRALEPLRQDPLEDVVEVVEEAIEMIAERQATTGRS